MLLRKNCLTYQHMLAYCRLSYGHDLKDFQQIPPKFLIQSEPKKLIRRLEKTPTSCDLNSEELRTLLEILLQIVDFLETPHDFEVYSHHLNSVLCSDVSQLRHGIVNKGQLFE